MPANLPPEFFEVEKKYRAARTIQEKIAALREMLSVMPRHKGTDKLHAEIRAKISRLQKELEAQKKTGKRTFSLYVPREGAGQVALMGYTNSGKSSLLSCLTNKKPLIADYPFTTTQPEVGMMDYEDIQIQIVDLPPVREEKVEYWQREIYRNCDLLALVVNPVSQDPISEVEGLLKTAEGLGIELSQQDEYSLTGRQKKRFIWIFTHADHPQAQENLEFLKEEFPAIKEEVLVSCKDGRGLEELKERIFRKLRIIRVYTKEPGKQPDLTDPLILPEGADVVQAAERIHKDFARNLKYARVWGSAKFPGQRVERGYILKDKDIVEFHI